MRVNVRVNKRVKNRGHQGLPAATLFVLTIAAACAAAQGPPPAPGVQAAPAQGGRGAAGAGGGRRVGGFVPGQQRPPGDPVQIARGKTLYGISCTGCHGADLRGGDIGGPNLLRSQVALSDRDGELIRPIIQGSRQDAGMPAVAMSPDDALAVAAYVRSVLETIGTQGKPPAAGQEAPSVLVGNASEGQAYFAAKCSSCHSATGDLQGIATRISDPKALQNAWVSGGGGGRRGGRGAAPQGPADARTVMAAVTEPGGETVEGRLIRIDDFLVTVGLADGTLRSFRRDGTVPKVEIRDPMKVHRDLLSTYSDKAMHDMTAYLVTLK
jgi:cytochrome c oxidase cbb3-type subunit 3